MLTPPPASQPQSEPSSLWKPLFGLIGLTLFTRLVLLGLYFSKPDASWLKFLSYSDAGSFLNMAQVFAGRAPVETLSLYDLRVFPGWPLLIGSWLSLLPATAALLGLTLAFAAAVPCLVYLLTRSFAASVALAVLPPVWLHASSQPIAEAAFLFFATAAILGASRQSWLLAGLTGGLACIIKPYGIFLAAGLALAAAREGAIGRRIRNNAVLLSAALLPVGLAVLYNLVFLGHPLPQLQVYSAPLAQLNISPETANQLGGAHGHWGWPFAALVQTPLRLATPLWKIVYVYANLAAALYLTARGCRRLRRRAAGWEWSCAAWLVGNTLACLCAGPYWGFHAFDRYVLWAWPAAILLNRDWFSLRLVIFLLPFSLGAAAFSILIK